MNCQVTTELFAMPYKEDFVIYAPLKHIALVMNQDAVQCLALIQEGAEIDVSSGAVTRFLEILEKYGIAPLC